MTSTRFSLRLVHGRVAILSALICAIVASQNCTADDARSRSWTDDSGQYTIEAEFEDYENGQVRLRKSDESDLMVPLDRLCDSDRSYVRCLLRQRQAKLRRKTLPVADLRTNTVESPQPDAKTVHGINWHPADKVGTLADAETAKPVMWFRVLGSLDGFM